MLTTEELAALDAIAGAIDAWAWETTVKPPVADKIRAMVRPGVTQSQVDAWLAGLSAAGHTRAARITCSTCRSGTDGR